MSDSSIIAEETSKGGIKYELVLEPPSVNDPPRKETITSPPKTMSVEEIEQKLKAAEERRLMLEAEKLNQINEKKSKLVEASQKRQEYNNNFIQSTKETLEQKMEIFESNREAKLRALQEKLKEHVFPEYMMPRKHIRKTDRTRKTSEEMLAAIKEVVEKGSSIRAASKAHGIAKSHLAREVTNFKKLPIGEYKYDSLVGNRRVFTAEQEKELAQYLLKASEHNHGFTSLQTRKLAYDFAVGCESQNIPMSWVANEQAGKDWFLGFMERNREHFGKKSPETNLIKETKVTNLDRKSDATSLVGEAKTANEDIKVQERHIEEVRQTKTMNLNEGVAQEEEIASSG